jgi:nucleotide-binding universal stress UspA family protein
MAAAPKRPGEAEAGTAYANVARRAHRSGAFERIVVPVDAEGVLSSRAVQAAARISSDKGTIVLVHVLEVPRELPLDALFPEEEHAAREVLRNAAAVAERYGIHVVQRLERAYSGAQAVLDLADTFEADLIVLGAPRRTRGGRSAFGPTATAILHRASCRVMLVTIAETRRPGHRPGSR